MLVLGFTAREIAGDLGLSFHTVRTHIRNIYEKLGVANRVELVRSHAEKRDLHSYGTSGST